ncbi:hypothetical protein [Bradyrhizobium sp. CCBAU 45384]|uniref:hypothetical protein n=1 Tax=Bradyrhizobium sp. CCBAU 45384 TaxID=858428 RepID=UPI0023069BF8|nr:hypothetical protein [Bradyrhizobium sp. CCBAU 45384]MDA9406064.1 hypothetical protein [Bradyrhizobium sp. CCBAU 45384]
MTTHINKVHHVTTLAKVAKDLGEDEDWLWDIANEVEIEDGVIWVYGVGEDGAAYAKRILEARRRRESNCRLVVAWISLELLRAVGSIAEAFQISRQRPDCTLTSGMPAADEKMEGASGLRPSRASA